MNARLALVACFALVQVSAFAALDASITFTSSKQGAIKGSNSDSSSTISTIEVFGFSQGEVLHGKTGDSGGGTGRVSMHDISITKATDTASPSLFKACANGNHIQFVLNIYITKNGKRTVQSHAVVNDAVITKATHIKVNGADMEQYQFTYQQIEWTWTEGGKTLTIK